MKKIILFTFRTLLIVSFFSCINRSFLKQGIISYQTYFSNYDSSTNLPLTNTAENKIWFNNNSVIYEIKIISLNAEHTPKGVVETNSLELLCYSYLDLNTTKCQDYYNLKETAIPLTNYILKPGEGYGWDFFNSKQSSDTFGIKISLPDTTIDKKVYKRIKLIKRQDTIRYEFEYYIDCKARNNMFYINPTIEEMYPGCKVVRSVFKLNSEPLASIFNTRIVAETISQEEKKIFSKWAQNSMDTKLPLTSTKEAHDFLLKHHK